MLVPGCAVVVGAAVVLFAGQLVEVGGQCVLVAGALMEDGGALVVDDTAASRCTTMVRGHAGANQVSGGSRTSASSAKCCCRLSPMDW